MRHIIYDTQHFDARYVKENPIHDVINLGMEVLSAFENISNRYVYIEVKAVITNLPRYIKEATDNDFNMIPSLQRLPYTCFSCGNINVGIMEDSEEEILNNGYKEKFDLSIMTCNKCSHTWKVYQKAKIMNS
jgi:hypothetical protein